MLDIGLPGMDGYEIARRLRQMDSLAGMRIVAVTGYGQKVDRERSCQSGFDEHLTKPVDPEALRTFIAGRAPPCKGKPTSSTTKAIPQARHD